MNIGDYLDEIAYDRNVLIGASMITEEDLRRDIADWNTARETLDRGSLATELKSDRVNCSDVCVCCFNSIVIFFLVVKYTNQRLITQGPSTLLVPYDWPR